MAKINLRTCINFSASKYIGNELWGKLFIGG